MATLGCSALICLLFLYLHAEVMELHETTNDIEFSQRGGENGKVEARANLGSLLTGAEHSGHILLSEGNARPVCQMQIMGLWGFPIVPSSRKQWRQNWSMVPNFTVQTNCICCCFVSNSKAETASPRHRCSIWPFITSEDAWISGFTLVTGRLPRAEKTLHSASNN